MNHYTYFLHLTNGQYYIGVRSCPRLPQDDSKYLGSSKHIKREDVVSKIIISTFESRKDAMQHEIELHNRYDVGRNPKFANRSCAKSTKFETPHLVANNHPSFDTTIYTFKNVDASMFVGTRYDFIKLFDLNPSAICAVIEKKRKSHRGWSHLDTDMSHRTKRGKHNPKFDKTEYLFQHTTGEIFCGTQFDFRIKYSLNPGHVCYLIKGKLKQHKGWSLVN